MKKDYFIIFIALCCVFGLNAQLDGTWRIAPEAGALLVGPEPGSDQWWSNDEQTLIDRTCYFDDEYAFNLDGSFNNILGSETWLEPWQGGAEPAGQCGVPVAPHNGAAAATFSYDNVAGTITINGTGAYLGLPIANNQGALPNVSVPSSITYNVVLSDNNNVMTLSIEVGLGVFHTYKLISDELVYITDDNFENYLETHSANGDVVALGDATSMGDGVLNNLTLRSKVAGVTELVVSENNIASLEGIEAFTNLELLHCRTNQIEVLDLSQNLALVELECESNQFSILDVSNNTALKVLGCAFNNLSSLDVSNNLLLEAIWFTNNNITSLNLDVNTTLRTYGLSNNPLVYMSIKNGNNANVQYIEALNLPSLSCIQVDDENAATYLSTNFSFVDESISFSNDCGTVYIPDNNFETYLETHSANGDVVALGDGTSMGDGFLNNLTLKSKVAGVTELVVSENNIASLQGIEAFANLEILHCRANQLEVLDVSQNLALVELECETNQFSTLDVSNNNALKVLGCANNNLSSLDVSNNLLLEAIWFTNNNITSLNLDVNTALRTYGLSENPLVYVSIKNGNNANMQYIAAQNLPTLTCIQVDDENAAYLSQNNWDVDPSISFSEDCGDTWTVYTSDTNVDAVLSSYGSEIDTSGDGEITLNEAAAYAGALDLSGQGITDIQGLQAFTSVTEINLSGNNISDLSVLFSSDAVVLTNKRAQFKAVANSSFTGLSVLDVSNNSLTSLDLSAITTLEELDCSNNLLNSLNVRNDNNAILTIFKASNNASLSCIQVDNATDANLGEGIYSTWNKDAIATYSTDCSSITLGIDKNEVTTTFSIYPNPVKNIIILKTNSIIDKVEIYNLIGQKVEEFKKERLKNNQIDVSTYPAGFYIMNTEMNGKVKSIKFIKE